MGTGYIWLRPRWYSDSDNCDSGLGWAMRPRSGHSGEARPMSGHWDRRPAQPRPGTGDDNVIMSCHCGKWEWCQAWKRELWLFSLLIVWNTQYEITVEWNRFDVTINFGWRLRGRHRVGLIIVKSGFSVQLSELLRKTLVTETGTGRCGRKFLIV